MQLTSVGGPITIQQTDATATAPINITNNDNNINLTTTLEGDINSSIGAGGQIHDTIAISAGVSNDYRLDAAGIRLTTKVTNALTLIEQTGLGGIINLATDRDNGAIQIGNTGAAAATNFNYFGSGEDLSMINTRGRTNWSRSGNGVTAAQTLESYRQINTENIRGGNIITQTGLTTEAPSAGVAYAAFIEGDVDPLKGSSIFIGKPNYYQAGGSQAPTENIGIFVNSGVTFPQGPEVSADDASLAPVAEKFSVTSGLSSTTKISNRLLYGGKNGVQVVYYDPMKTTSPVTDIKMTSAYLRIVVGSDARGGGVYTAASLAALNIANNNAFVVNFNITVDSGTVGWAEGQHAYVEVINSNNQIVINNAGFDNILRQYGTVNVNYAVYKDVAGTTVFSQPGIQSGIERSLQAVTPNPAGDQIGNITTVTQSGVLQLRGSNVDKVQFRFVEANQTPPDTNAVTANDLPLYWGLSGKVISSETYTQNYA